MTLLSIIIPTLNEERYLASCLTTLRQCAFAPDQIEVVIVDSGSTDNTLDGLGRSVRAYRHPELVGYKYKLLNRGADYARGDYLLFLDADTLVPNGYDVLIRESFTRDEVVGGAFEFSFIEKSLLLSMIEFCNRFRYRIRQSYYGDQGVFVSKVAFEEAGGFPPLRIMETAIFCRKLKKYGKLQLIKAASKTSARRFMRGGVMRVFWFDIIVWVREFFGFGIQHYAPDYWKENLVRF